MSRPKRRVLAEAVVPPPGRLSIVVGSTAMFERLAQYDNFHFRVGLPMPPAEGGRNSVLGRKSLILLDLSPG